MPRGEGAKGNQPKVVPLGVSLIAACNSCHGAHVSALQFFCVPREVLKGSNHACSLQSVTVAVVAVQQVLGWLDGSTVFFLMGFRVMG
jgi:hypothetical protein